MTVKNRLWSGINNATLDQLAPAELGKSSNEHYFYLILSLIQTTTFCLILLGLDDDIDSIYGKMAYDSEVMWTWILVAGLILVDLEKVDLTLVWFTAQGVISWGLTTAAVINWQSSKNDNSQGLNFVSHSHRSSFPGTHCSSVVRNHLQ